MALIKKFEDIIAWHEARNLVKMVYKLTSTGDFSKDFGLRDQIRRASVSTMTNIAEGFDCESKLEFARFLVIARRSSVKSNHFYTQRLILVTLMRIHAKHITTMPTKPKA